MTLLGRLGHHDFGSRGAERAQPRGRPRAPRAGPGFTVEIHDWSLAPRAGSRAPLPFAAPRVDPGRRPKLLDGSLDRLTLPSRAELDAALAELGAPVSEGAVFLDTETTGLAGGALAFVIGLAWYADGRLRVGQWTLARLGAEAEMLADLLAKLAELRPAPLASFNGASFDLPLLRLRAQRHGLDAGVLGGPHLDLLTGARRMWRGRLPDCRLATLERAALAVDRRNDIPSAEIPAVFEDWLRAPDDARAQRRLRAVCEHNHADLVSLPALARHLADLLREPGDLDRAHRAARHLQRSGAEERGRELLAAWVEPAIAQTRGSSALAGGLRAAAFELASWHRRAGELERAASLWRWLWRSDPRDPEACEAWAKHLEHRRRAIAEALRVARSSRIPCPRRIARLERKLGQAGPPAPRSEPSPEPEAGRIDDPPRATVEPRAVAPGHRGELLQVVDHPEGGARMRYRLLRSV